MLSLIPILSVELHLFLFLTLLHLFMGVLHSCQLVTYYQALAIVGIMPCSVTFDEWGWFIFVQI